MSAKGIVIAAPSSGSGKTLVSLGLMAAVKRKGVRVAAAKVGPDYIDPAFHRAALGRFGTTLDGWAMGDALLASRVARASEDADLVICEGVMGLLDGADVPAGDRDGSTGQIAKTTGWPVILVVDGGRMAGSAAAVVCGFAHVRDDVQVAGVIFNRVGTERHKAMILRSMQHYCPTVAVLGFLPYSAALVVPSRHLGLVQAAEHPDLQAFIDAAAGLIEQHVDLDLVMALAQAGRVESTGAVALRPLGQRIALAQDVAFAFAYNDIVLDWRKRGAEIVPFSPLADQAPASDCDAVYLPGGYPELSAGLLAGNSRFKSGLKQAAERGATLFGECGGYMVMGQTMIDEKGIAHEMAGVLPVVTSMENPKRHLGYRRATLVAGTSLGEAGTVFKGHEYHYAVEISRQGPELFQTSAADGLSLCSAGCLLGGAMGSFVHLISAESIGC